MCRYVAGCNTIVYDTRGFKHSYHIYVINVSNRMALPTTPLSFSDLRRVIGPNDTSSISLGQCRPGYPPGHGKGIIGVTDTNIAMSQFQGKSKLNNGFTFRAFKGPSYTFSAGAGGGFPSTSYNYRSPGSGGAGGIMVNGTAPTTFGSQSYTGAGYPKSYGGYNGQGYGAGGGGGGYIGNFQMGGAGGYGTGGFIYLYLNGSEVFTTSSTDYNCTTTGTLKYIMIGSGGSGGSNATTSYSAAGGWAGNIQYGDINVISGDAISLVIDSTSARIAKNGTGIVAAASGGSGAAPASATGSSAGGGPGDGQWFNVWAGSSGGNGTRGQGTAHFNAAINHIANISGYFSSNPSFFTTNVPFASGTTTNMTNITTATSSTFTANGSSKTLSVEWSGKFYPSTTGSYTFYLASDEASYLWIGSTADSGYTVANANINNSGSNALPVVSYTITLTTGIFYPIRIQYGQTTGTYDCQFSFEGPGITRTYNVSGYVYTP